VSLSRYHAHGKPCACCWVISSGLPLLPDLHLRTSCTHICQHHSAVQCHSLCKAVHHMVYLTAKSTVLVQFAQQLACCAAVSRVLHIMQGLQDCPRHFLSQPHLASDVNKLQNTTAVQAQVCQRSKSKGQTVDAGDQPAWLYTLCKQVQRSAALLVRAAPTLPDMLRSYTSKHSSTGGTCTLIGGACVI
jgi:hypothetical protein